MESRIWSTLLLFFILLTGIHAVRFSPWMGELDERDNETIIEVRDTPMTWWDATERGCDDVNPEGVVAGVEGNVSALLEAMSDGQEYWMGVAKTPARWRWRDNTPLYKYIGYHKSTVTATATHTIADNEVFLCADTCKTQFIGLQGTTCYCLAGIGDSTLIPGKVQFACRGNHAELCGNADGISFYESEAANLIRWNNAPAQVYNGQTTYIRMDDSGSYPVLELTTSTDLTRKMFFLCTTDGLFGSFGLRTINMTWAEAWLICLNLGSELGHIHGANRAEILQALNNNQDRNTYWLGLFRNIAWRRLDGSQLTLTVNGDVATTTTRQCLVATKSGSSLVLHSRNCRETRRVLCRVPVMLPTTTLACPTTAPQETVTPEVRVVEVLVNRTVTASPAQVQALSAQATDSFTIVTMAVGLAACIMVIIVLVVVLAVRRKRQKDLLGLPEAPKKFPPNVVFNPVFKRPVGEDEEAVRGRPLSTVSTYDLNDFSGGDPNALGGLKGRPESAYYNSLSFPRINSPRQGGARPVSKAFNSLLAACPEVAGDEDHYDNVSDQRLGARGQGSEEELYAKVPTTPDRGVPANSEYVYFCETSAGSSSVGFPPSSTSSLSSRSSASPFLHADV